MVKAAAIRIADQVWIAVALLHREHPDAEAFTAPEIIERVRREFGQVSQAISPHIYLHCVANKPPNPGRYRMLFETATGHWRLYRPKDATHPGRTGSKCAPKPQQVPAAYHELIDWYETEYAMQDYIFKEDDPLFKLFGIGDSGLSDVSENKHKYLAQAYFEHLRDDTATRDP